MIKTFKYFLWAPLILIILLDSCKKDDPSGVGQLQIIASWAGAKELRPGDKTTEVSVKSVFTVEFTTAVEPESAAQEIYLSSDSGSRIPTGMDFLSEKRKVLISPEANLDYLTDYSLVIGSGLKGSLGEGFPGYEYGFSTEPGILKIDRISLNGIELSLNETPMNIPIKSVEFEITFSEPLQPQGYEDFFSLTGGASLVIEASENRQVILLRSSSELSSLKRYNLLISSNLVAESSNRFLGFSLEFYTALDSTYKFPEIPDEELLNLIQERTFSYFYDFAHPVCGMARERNTSNDIVTTGGSGFGVMSLVVGMERHWISRNEGLLRMNHILSFLETCDRYHGAWPHWLNGQTGKTIPFNEKDDGGDLVETAFLIQGLLTFREYLDSSVPEEAEIRSRIYTLWSEVEWNWYTQGQQVLYWHWSPNYGFSMNHQIRGHNETLITYVLAASSPTYPVSAKAYHQGYSSNGGIVNGRSYYGISLPLGPAYGGPLFFAHYSFLGLDPRNLKDQYADYWEQNVAHAKINQLWCEDNPYDYLGYSLDCWGLTASDNQEGYSAHSPTNDKGVITPTAAISSIPYTPEESMRAIWHFYYLLGDKLWGPYGFYDAFNISVGWWADSYIAIDQGPEILMIENYRTGLLWDLLMKNEEIQNGLNVLGFTY